MVHTLYDKQFNNAVYDYMKEAMELYRHDERQTITITNTWRVKGLRPLVNTGDNCGYHMPYTGVEVNLLRTETLNTKPILTKTP